ncbi:carbohydrate-binding module family 26 protein [Piromyces sp. E2]|nr:carbohydrate-binding module family 26 protein [Piromyces sp. E2]|eukprot:OUM59631.1 carbohydrate-binding module family 26 protein [Piromyces sp. E2]
MKSLNIFAIFCTLFLSQIFSIFASPLPVENIIDIEKKSFTPFELHTSAIYFLKPSNWGDDIYAYHYSEDNTMNTYPYQQWPGRKMKKMDGFYYDIFYNQYFMTGNRKVIFTDGKNQVPGVMESGFNLVIDAVYNQYGITGISYYKPESDNSVFNNLRYNNIGKIYYKSNGGGNGSKIMARYQEDDGEWIDTYLTSFDSRGITGYYTTTLVIGHAKTLSISFDDSNKKFYAKLNNKNNTIYKFDSYSNFIISPEYTGISSISKRSFTPFELHTSAIYFLKPSNWSDDIYVYHYSEDNAMYTHPYQQWPVIFTDGKHQIPSSNETGFDLVIDAVYNENGIIGISYDKPESDSIVDNLKYGNLAKLCYKNNLNNVNRESSIIAHYQIGNKSWTDSPLKSFDSKGYTHYYCLTIDLDDADKLSVAFYNSDLNSNEQWDNNNGENYTFNKYSNFIVNNY